MLNWDDISIVSSQMTDITTPDCTLYKINQDLYTFCKIKKGKLPHFFHFLQASGWMWNLDVSQTCNVSMNCREYQQQGKSEGFESCDRPTVLEIPTGPPVRGRQLWMRTGKFMLIFLQFHVYDLWFKAWGPTTFLTEFQTLPAYSPETPNLGQNRWCFVPCDLEIWWMTLENNRASLLCCFKLCATFHSHLWIQTGVTVRKGPIWVKFDDF